MNSHKQMILLAESGSTKTSWKLIDPDGSVKSFSSPGINPVLQRSGQIEEDQTGYLSPIHGEQVDEVYFYGAGCGGTESSGSVREWLSSLFPSATLTVDSDLIAAAKSLFGDDNGVVAILGTGSNSCYYEDGEIKRGVPSLGYILGDEGSGNQIGSQLIADYLRGVMPTEIQNFIREQFNITESSVLAQVYSQPYPNRYMASFVAPISKAFGDHRYFQNVLESQFRAFFDNCLSKYSELGYCQIGFVGSIAYHFRPMLKKLCEVYEFDLRAVNEKPIDQLIEYIKTNQKTH
ncbi:hypothetical protein [Reichenbachiella agariperforans]|uniref:hypothetical protein n=1 Tax=Reichenbachiella agariperforans TaxID=156994 RepID=UPI001C08A197|nr:hypothetical protein [Reichenbachiella agariperforans]MBU2914207.1 hypothetical protein [Reichenbachiella agariperforans]